MELRDGVVVVALCEDVGRDPKSGSTESSRGPLVLLKGGSGDDQRRLTLGGEGRRLGDEDERREVRGEGDEREKWIR
jgi:hypothetical protein